MTIVKTISTDIYSNSFISGLISHGMSVRKGSKLFRISKLLLLFKFSVLGTVYQNKMEGQSLTIPQYY